MQIVQKVGTTFCVALIVMAAVSECFALEVEQKLADSFAAEVTRLLPHEIEQTIGKDVLLRFAKLDSNPEIIAPACPGETSKEAQVSRERSVLGKTRTAFQFGSKSTIFLNRNFLKEIAKGPEGSRGYSCGHRNLYRLAVATAIHELSHLYFKAKGASFRANYREFLAWKRGILNQNSKNRFYGRSPDPYEYRNLAEHFAVNAEFFLLDPEYRCRRPEQYRYFEKHFRYSAHSVAPACQLNTQVRLATSLQPVPLDPSRVYGIHYLLADRGKAMESRWGHAMFRIIQCAPDRPQVVPECVQDIGSHIVVSFRANVSGTTVNKFDGLTGKYPSQLFLYSMPEIIGEYTMSESRPLKSVPLRLTQEQVDRFVRRTLELYWEYQGRYYFLGNNCGTEALHLLTGVLADTESEREVTGSLLATPTGIYERFRNSGLLDESVFSESRANGRYLFPSFVMRAEEAFRTIALRKGFVPGLGLESYLRDYGAADRRALYLQMKAADPDGMDRIAIQFYTLELLVRERQNAWLKRFAARMKDAASAKSPESTVRSSSELSRLVREVFVLRSELQPWYFASKGYGVPLAADYRDLSDYSGKIQMIRDRVDRIMNEIRIGAGDVFEEFEGISENTRFFRMEIKNTKNGS